MGYVAATASLIAVRSFFSLSLGAKPQAGCSGGDAMGSCQSRLHRHKAGGGQEEPLGLSLKADLKSARPRTAFHRVHYGGAQKEALVSGFSLPQPTGVFRN